MSIALAPSWDKKCRVQNPNNYKEQKMYINITYYCLTPPSASHSLYTPILYVCALCILIVLRKQKISDLHMNKYRYYISITYYQS